MGALLEAVGVLALIVLVFVVVLAVLSVRNGPQEREIAPATTRPVSDRHTHRWTRWQVVDERRVHLYRGVDEGRELPDRIDVVLRRECTRCGLPQTQTVRGLDAKWRF